MLSMTIDEQTIIPTLRKSQISAEPHLLNRNIQVNDI